MDTIPSEVLLLVFLHGFKGGADTFDKFPERITHILSALRPEVDVQPIVYPPYDTRGELVTAVDNHVSWLTNLVVERSQVYKEKGGKGQVRVVLLGHSMGGLVIADSVLSTLQDANPWPVILGVIAYDTPYYGLNPAVFKNTAEKVIGYVKDGNATLAALGAGWGAFSAWRGTGGITTPPIAPTPPRSQSPATSSSANSMKGKEKAKVASSQTVATTDPTSSTKASNASWFSFPVVAAGAAAAVVGAAGAAYYNRETITTSWTWATSHLSFVRELVQTEAMELRMTQVTDANSKGVRFHCFYTLLAPETTKPQPSPSRTFIVVPRGPVSELFTPNLNRRASDEIQAHIEMFTEKSDGIYELATKSSDLLNSWLLESRSEARSSTKTKVNAPQVKSPRLV